MKHGFKLRVNIYSALAAWTAIIFGVIMGSGLFIFLGFALLLIVFLGLRKAIYADNITRIEHGNRAEVYVNGVLFSSDELLEIELYDFSHS